MSLLAFREHCLYDEEFLQFSSGQKYGFGNLYNLKGGILAWAEEIDGTIPKYGVGEVVRPLSSPAQARGLSAPARSPLRGTLKVWGPSGLPGRSTEEGSR